MLDFIVNIQYNSIMDWDLLLLCYAYVLPIAIPALIVTWYVERKDSRR